jgi:phosphoribosylaminoimidazole-succinocarboxamide synthase
LPGTVLSIEIPGLKKFASGKVRDIFDLGDSLLLVATDRISAFDSVMQNGIPDKGRVLTQLSRFWFERFGEAGIVDTHFIATDLDPIADAVTKAGGVVDGSVRAMLAGRSTLGRKASTLPVECVARGYISGSLWKEYRDAGGASRSVTLHGIEFPAGLRESDRLPAPIFTPATKASTGHDENIGMSETIEIVGKEMAERLQGLCLALYAAAAEHALKSGVIIADTKFEFGLRDGSILLIDEALTPDSSRFWDVETYKPGGPQPSFDKQFVRDWLEASGWNKEPPAPALPEDVVEKTAEKYREAYRRIVGAELPA